MLLTALLSLLHVAHAEPNALTDAGITVDIPGGWEMTRWSDWDWKGKAHDGTVAIEVWYTTFQLPITKESAKGWAPVYREKLEDMRATDVVMDDVSVADAYGRPTARTAMKFSFEKGGPKGVMEVAAFPVDGKVIHVATLSTAQNVSRAKSALETMLERLTVQKPAAAIVELGGEAKTDLGFTATLPDGWRRPLASETEAAGKILSDVGIGPSEPDKCLHAIRPAANGDAELVLFCAEPWKMGIVDDYSFADEELLLKQRFFGKGADKVPAATRLERKDRLGYVLAPEIKGRDLRIAALPYDRGTVVAWGVGAHGTAEDLESTIRAMSSSLNFEGPDGGASVHEVGEWVVHTLTYNPFHPAVLGAGFGVLVMMGGIGALVFRKAPRTDGV